MEINLTERGFEVADAMDSNGKEWSLQQSSAIGDYDDSFDRPGSSYVWLGSGEERMHLNREQVGELVSCLVNWLRSGSFKES